MNDPLASSRAPFSTGLQWLYSSVFFAWYKLVFSRDKQAKAWNACMIVTMLEGVLVLGAYTWCQVLCSFPPPPLPYAMVGAIGLIVANFRVMHSGAWSRMVTSLESLPEDQQRARLAVGWITSAAAAAFWILAIGTLQNWE